MKKKEYQKLIRVSKSKYIDQWIKRGYMPGVVLTPDGDAEIPEDMPRPYKSNGKTKKNFKTCRRNNQSCRYAAVGLSANVSYDKRGYL